jgi:hypothetical protein
MKTAIVLQGRLSNDFIVQNIIEVYKDVKDDVVISTWVNEYAQLVDILKENGFNVLLNEVPDFLGINNCNLQTVSTQRGISNFLNSDYTHVLKMRTDIVPFYNIESDIINSGINKFIEVLRDISEEELVFLCWFDQYNENYVCDFFSFGPIDKSFKFWNVFQDPDNYQFPEWFLTFKYSDIIYPEYEQIKNIFKFSINELEKNNIKLIRTNPEGTNFGLDQVYAYLHITQDVLKKYN